MSEVAIADLPATAIVNTNDLLVIVQGGVTKNVQAQFLGTGGFTGTGQLLYNNAGVGAVTATISYSESGGDIIVAFTGTGGSIDMVASGTVNSMYLPLPNFPGDGTTFRMDSGIPHCTFSNSRTDGGFSFFVGDDTYCFISRGSGIACNGGNYIGWSDATANGSIPTGFKRDDAGVIGTSRQSFAGGCAIRAGCPVPGVVSLSGTGIEGDTVPILTAETDSGGVKFAVGNDGGVWTGTSFPASTPGSIIGAVPLYDLTGTLLGYLPVYDSIS